MAREQQEKKLYAEIEKMRQNEQYPLPVLSSKIYLLASYKPILEARYIKAPIEASGRGYPFILSSSFVKIHWSMFYGGYISPLTKLWPGYDI